ncbi:MAG: acyl carrier protein [Alphaproteobacteria bacterium]|nr:acyl carrier protein [Alphaproteobacteria bacterium]NCQ87693.1 acyl carrier protein [Alphaproteobacteria bacterium]NCT05798.1 acyl carrier protein [Alphaproteobacteria bacterium]
MSDPLIDLFADVLEVNAETLNDDSTPESVGAWDSLAAMHLVAAIEDTFKCQLSTKEIMKMSSIGLARKALKDKGIEV